MTPYPDKPKRKRTPSRRKFLLMIIALIVGFMALSPQIDAWLATDPFTPQCEVTDNHRFLVYGETYMTDFEGSHYFISGLDGYSEYYEHHFWYDKQRHLVYMTDGGVSYPGYTATWIVNMETKQHTKIPDSLRYNTFARSNQFLVKGSTLTNKVDIIDVFNQELMFREQLSFDPYKRFLFSPSEAFVLIYGDENSPSYIFDLLSQELQTLPDIKVIGWLDDVYLFYETDQRAIYTYHVVTGEQTQLMLENFDSDPPPNNLPRRFYAMSDDGRWIALKDNQAKLSLWDTQENTHRILDPITFLPMSSMTIHGDYLVYNFEDAEGRYWFYSFFEDEYLFFQPYGYPIYISPSGKHIFEKIQRANIDYHRISTLGQKQEHIIYDLPALDYQNWISIDGQDYVFYSIPLTSNDLGERKYYLIEPSSGSQCKLGIWDSSEDFSIG